VASRDGTTVASPAVDVGVDRYAQAKALYEKAHAALEDGDPEQALELLEQSLALRPRALTYLEQARALQRMGRVDDAIAAVDRAIDANKTYAPAYEQKGMILWSAQRYDEARPVLEKCLELDPDGRRAETIKSMLAEPK
jgi:tetratricopeptide (TPR) repeat protein